MTTTTHTHLLIQRHDDDVLVVLLLLNPLVPRHTPTQTLPTGVCVCGYGWVSDDTATTDTTTTKLSPPSNYWSSLRLTQSKEAFPARAINLIRRVDPPQEPGTGPGAQEGVLFGRGLGVECGALGVIIRRVALLLALARRRGQTGKER